MGSCSEGPSRSRFCPRPVRVSKPAKGDVDPVSVEFRDVSRFWSSKKTGGSSEDWRLRPLRFAWLFERAHSAGEGGPCCKFEQVDTLPLFRV